MKTHNGIVIGRSDIVLEVSKRLKISNCDAETVLNCILDVMRENLEKTNAVALRGLGTFRFKAMQSRRSWNPSTNTPLVTLPRTRLKFLPALALKKKIAVTPLVPVAASPLA